MKLALQRRAEQQAKINRTTVEEEILKIAPKEIVVEDDMCNDKTLPPVELKPIQTEVVIFKAPTIEDNICVVTVVVGSLKVELTKPKRSIFVQAPNSITIPKTPHRITIQEEGTCWNYSFSQTNSKQGNLWSVRWN